MMRPLSSRIADETLTPSSIASNIVRRRASESSRTAPAALSSVMSEKDARTAYGLASPGRVSDRVLTDSQTRVPSGLEVPMITLVAGWPVSSVTRPGWVAAGNGVPSSWIASHAISAVDRPPSSSPVRPRIDCAAAFQA